MNQVQPFCIFIFGLGREQPVNLIQSNQLKNNHMMILVSNNGENQSTRQGTHIYTVSVFIERWCSQKKIPCTHIYRHKKQMEELLKSHISGRNSVEFMNHGLYIFSHKQIFKMPLLG